MERLLPLLTGGPRDAPAHQRTMRAAIAWSHDLLTPEEQLVFRRLATFEGGFTLEAVERVTVVAPPVSIVEVLRSLVDQSLVQVLDDTSDPRFSIFETVRESALEQLAEQIEVESKPHTDYFLALAERAEPELTGPSQATWLDRLETEHGNVRPR
jgi:predicted ATPase